jgi:hypothetical protein
MVSTIKNKFGWRSSSPPPPPGCYLRIAVIFILYLSACKYGRPVVPKT